MDGSDHSIKQRKNFHCNSLDLLPLNDFEVSSFTSRTDYRIIAKMFIIDIVT